MDSHTDYSVKGVDGWHPPTHVAREVIKHAIRNIPGKQVLLAKLDPPKYNHLGGLKPHVYNNSGKLQFGFFG